MSDSLLSAPTAAPVQPVTSRARRRVRRAGWLLAALMSLSAVFISFIPITTPTGQLLLLSLALLEIAGMFVAAGLLIGGYHEFFGQARGVAVWLAVFTLSVYLSSEAIVSAAGPVLSSVLVVTTLWGFVGSIAVGPTLLLYLIRSDKSVAVFAITYLLMVWAMFALGQYLGWDVLLQQIFFGAANTKLVLFQTLVCSSIWVTVTASVAFSWNTLVYLARERAGVEQLVTSSAGPTPPNVPSQPDTQGP